MGGEVTTANFEENEFGAVPFPRSVPTLPSPSSPLTRSASTAMRSVIPAQAGIHFGPSVEIPVPVIVLPHSFAGFGITEALRGVKALRVGLGAGAEKAQQRILKRTNVVGGLCDRGQPCGELCHCANCFTVLRSGSTCSSGCAGRGSRCARARPGRGAESRTGFRGPRTALGSRADAVQGEESYRKRWPV